MSVVIPKVIIIIIIIIIIYAVSPADPQATRMTMSIIIIIIIIIIIFKPSVKKYPKVEQKIKDIVVAGMNTNPLLL